MPTIDCGHGNGRRNRLPHLAGSIVWRTRWGRRFRLPAEADFHRSSKSRKRLCTRERGCLSVLGNAGLGLPQWVRIRPHGGADPLVRGRRPHRPAAMDAHVSARVRSRPGAGCGPGGPPHRGESHSKIPKTDRHPRSGCSNTSDTVFSYPLRPSLGVMAREQREAPLIAYTSILDEFAPWMSTLDPSSNPFE